MSVSSVYIELNNWIQIITGIKWIMK